VSHDAVGGRRTDRPASARERQTVDVDEPTGIASWQRLTDRITTSGQPTDEQLADLARLGVRHIINLALHDHELALDDETATLASLGVRYTHIPVPFDEPTEAHWDAFCAAMADSEAAGEAVHVHCIANYRVSAFMYRWHRDVQQMPEPDARALMAQQWQPDRTDQPAARPWAVFIAP